MRYEVRLNGKAIAAYATPEEALERVREMLQQDADLQLEIIDLETGRSYAPAASVPEGEELATKVGF
jgi:hypothetical protein